jgi:hypothetical protein
MPSRCARRKPSRSVRQPELRPIQVLKLSSPVWRMAACSWFSANGTLTGHVVLRRGACMSFIVSSCGEILQAGFGAVRSASARRLLHPALQRIGLMAIPPGSTAPFKPCVRAPPTCRKQVITTSTASSTKCSPFSCWKSLAWILLPFRCPKRRAGLRPRSQGITSRCSVPHSLNIRT